MKQATWYNRESQVTGRYEWLWQSQRFVIELDRKISGRSRIVTAGSQAELPEWGRWKLVTLPDCPVVQRKESSAA